MQPPAGPDRPDASAPLPHTRSRPAHWLATAAALAAVILGAALTGPGDATAGATAPAKAPAGPPAAAPDPGAARYPVDCGPTRPEVVRRATADLDGDGRPETAVEVRCGSGGGTRPSGVYVLAAPAAPGAAPRVVATLVDPKEGMSITGLDATGRTVSATLLGYSGSGVPRCCPDLRRAVKWHWRDGQFVLTAQPIAESA
ncbi:hypothetical protein [Streptomyces abikoensis]|uniref:hypothetical protein n=1 Tax=Streptomyces abikoensis TaxID=97398 RepID=UPI00167A33E0|nr:hypothetical protein [Streptomyces abikoensis]GGP63158.1 hypothetical protein GCM10010214_41280 [Streptomyces abikoensis]